MANVIGLFAVPVYTNIYEGNLEQEIEYLESLEYADSNDWTRSNYGELSKDTYVLNNPEVKTLRNWIVDCVNEYAIEVCKYHITEMGLTQSWVSAKSMDQMHQRHDHANSLVSGVFYWQDNCSPLVLSQDSRDLIRVNKDFDAVAVPPSKQGLILFPSYMQHHVDPIDSDNVRYSLAFNSVPLNSIGSKEELNEIDYNKVYGKL
jgi:uncharacterized protein (TIGR02466 family)